MTLFLLLTVFWVAKQPLLAQRPDLLSEDAVVSVITCAPGQEELYTAFGHSAIRLYDSQKAIDLVFNYGAFNFNQPNFYLNFTRGDLLYELHVSPYSDFIIPYVYHNRSVREQLLNLSSSQKQRVFDFLQQNALSENKTYYYDYFYDNCATRIRDVFVKVLSDTLQFDSAFIRTNYTIRNLTDRYLSYQPWGDLGIDICLGLPMDKRARPTEYMFLPDYVEAFFDSAQLITTTGSKPLVAEKRSLFTGRSDMPSWRWWHPWVIFAVMLLITIGISIYDLLSNRLSYVFDAILLCTTGLLGCLLLFLWLATNHKAAAYNFNLLWALPSNIVVLFMLWGRKKVFLLRYFGFAFFLTLTLLASWLWLPQQLNSFLLPVVLSLGIRYGVNYRLRKMFL